MNERTVSILRDPRLLAARDGHFRRLGGLFAGQTPDPAFVLQGINGQSDADPYVEPDRWVDEALDSLAAQAERLADSEVFRPLCLEFAPFGVHFADRILGAKVYRADGQWWCDRLASPVGELRPPDPPTSETFRLAAAAAEAFLARQVTVPLFVVPTIASALNVAVNLYGEEILAAMLTRPEAARRDLAVINDLLCRLHRWYLERIPASQLQPTIAAGRCQPPGYGQLCGCSSHLLSARTYRDFIAPLDEALLSVYPAGGMIHLCGDHARHVPAWREMPSLRAVQVNDRAADDLETYFRGLRDDQVFYVNPTRTMTVERIMDVTAGRRVVIVADVPPPKVAARGAASIAPG